MDQTKPKDIKKSWQEYTEDLHKKDLNDPDNHDDMISHLEPDILECEVKWALGNITTNKCSGGDGIATELFQILKDDAVKGLHSIMPGNLENSAVVTELEKVSFHSSPKEVNETQSCPTLCDPIDYTVHGIPQARILEWVTFPFFSVSS